jgi:DNA polymerase-3 subunit gamma/tau
MFETTATTPTASEAKASLYLRYRPRTFTELVGQDEVAALLVKALAAGNAHHAYLFAGARGSGKTTTARLVAAALNCRNASCAEPCGSCESCLSVATGGALDVHEIDAATHTGVDDARSLRETCALLPMGGNRRVFILDEAHMLSRNAWSALLKTIEEPPAHAVFILCTTEVHKLPATILDRCHRFTFRVPAPAVVEALLERVAGAEGIRVDADARSMLAFASRGSLRDALGLLDQARSYADEGAITPEVVQTIAGLAQPVVVDNILTAVATDDVTALRELTTALNDGQEANALLSTLEARLRELLIVKTLGRVPKDLTRGEATDAALLEQAKKIKKATVSHMLDLIGFAREAVRCGADPRCQLEHAIVKASQPSMYAAVEKLMTRLERAERSTAKSAKAE